MFAVITVMMLLVATGKHSTTAAQRASWPTRKVLSSGQSMLMAVEMEMEERRCQRSQEWYSKL